jgi:hypothetical protein
MSLSYVPLTPIKVLDPLLEVNDVKGVAILQGANQISYKQFSSTSISASSIQWTCNPPSGNTIVDRMQYAAVPVRLTFTGVAYTTNNAYQPATSLLNAGHDAFRKFPLQSAIETLNVTINGDSISQNMADVIHPLSSYYETDEKRTGVQSLSPSMGDQSCNYADLVGTERNVLAGYGTSQQGSSEPRGGFASQLIVNNATVVPTVAGVACTAVVDAVLSEQLFLSPFFVGCQGEDRQGFYNVIDMNFNMNFLANAGARMWSHSAGAVATSGANFTTTVITSCAVSFSNYSPAFSFPTNGIPQMYFKYLTPNLLSNQRLGALIPQSYSYFDINRYATDIGTLTYAQGSAQYTSNNIQLATIPKKLYLWVRPTNNALQSRFDLTDTYLSIEGVSIQFVNESSLLSAANKRQLYLIDQKNHSGKSWSEWCGEGVYKGDSYVGGAGVKIPTGAGCLCLDFGTDIQLTDPSLTPGINGQFQIQVTLTVKNQNSGLQWDAVPMSLYLCPITEGVFTIPALGQANHQIGIISKTDVLMAGEQEGISYRDAAIGGDLWSTLKNVGSNVNDFLKNTKIISTVGKLIPNPIAQGVGQFADTMGYGLIHGGALMDRKEIANGLNAKRRLMDR